MPDGVVGETPVGGLTHVDEHGKAHMVDVTGKPPTLRIAEARCSVHTTADVDKLLGHPTVAPTSSRRPGWQASWAPSRRRPSFPSATRSVSKAWPSTSKGHRTVSGSLPRRPSPSAPGLRWKPSPRAPRPRWCSSSHFSASTRRHPSKDSPCGARVAAARARGDVRSRAGRRPTFDPRFLDSNGQISLHLPIHSP